MSRTRHIILHSAVERNLKLNYQQKLEHQKYLANYYETRTNIAFLTV